jgi:GDP-mannose 6-dehydrogenase
MANDVLPLLATILAKEANMIRVCFNPEFLREGSAISDFFAPPFTVIGVEAPENIADTVVADMESVYSLAGVPTVRLNYKEAELVKVISNAFHALKIDFANEVGSLAARVGADPVRLMDAFCLDTKLNIAGKYLRPGFAFGGSCLPKDVRGLIHVAQSLGLSLPVMESILPSNHQHLKRALALLTAQPGQVFGIAGLVFKADTDDVRESPAVNLARALIDQGKEVLIYEPEIQIERLVGANLASLEERLPEFRKCFVDWPTFRSRAEVVAISRSGFAAEISSLVQPVVRLYSLEGY